MIKNLICGALVVGGAMVAAATEIPERDWEYEKLDDDHVVIHSKDQTRQASAIDPSTAGDITVPAKLREMLVVSIGEKAFYNCSKLTSVTIPEGVTNIADNAFYGCTSLTNVVFPTSLKGIGTSAFYNCSKLAAANLTGASLTLGTHAFRDCSSIRDLTFSGDLISIGEYAFSGCTGLRDVALAAKTVMAGTCAFSVYYPGSVISSACTGLTNVVVDASTVSLGEKSFYCCTALMRLIINSADASLGGSSFSDCTALLQATINSAVATLGGSSFSGCTALLQADVASSNLTVSASAFASCTSLTNAVLVGAGAATIGASAFSECSKLRSVSLPVALTAVATNAFYKCSSLQAIAFPSNVTHIFYRAFDTCTALKTIAFPERLESIDVQAFYGCSAVTDLTFPQSLEYVGDRAFERCSGMGAVRFEEGNTNRPAATSVTLGERVFYQCTAVTNVALPQTLASTGERAFAQCEALASVNLPTNYTDIAVSAFEDCTSLPTIDLPATLRSIGNAAFFGCTSLTGFLIPTNNVVELGNKAFNNTKYWNDQPDGLVVNNGYILGFKGNPTSVTLPDGCKAIPVGMFEDMTALVSVTIPDSVTTIGARAFAGSGITSIAFNGVTTMGNSAFEGCASLANVSLSAVLSAIPGNAFKNCTALTSVAIPDAVTSVGEYAFYNCRRLSVVTGAAGVTQVGDYAFAECPALLPFEFPNDVAYGDHVFQGCTWTEHVLFPSVGTLKDEYPATYAEIKSIVFSSNMSVITNGACSGCVSLEYVRIPDGVTTIGAQAFAGCSSLTSVVMSASVEIVVSNSFEGCSGIVSAVVSGLFPVSTAFPKTYAKMATIGLASGCQKLTEGLFAGCLSLTSVDIPWTVQTIGARAFYGCTSIADSIVVPEQVTTIESQAFAYCKQLRAVNYLCDMPSSVSDDIYEGTRGDLLSKVLPGYENWQSTTNSAGATILPTEWPAGNYARPIVWWASVKVDRIAFAYNDGTGQVTRQYYLSDAGRYIYTLPVPTHPQDYTFEGWWTAPYGGTQIVEGTPVDGSVTYYAHWSNNGITPGDEYDFSKPNVYNGWLTDGESVAGSVQVKLSKGRLDKSTDETNATATATIQLLGAGKATAKGKLYGDGSAELTVSKTEQTMDFDIDAYSLRGSFDGYEVVGYRNLFATSDYDEKAHANAMLDDTKGKYVVVLAAEGDGAFATGYVALSAEIMAKGKCKVTGVMPDGTKVSVTSQLLISPADESADDVGYVPVVAPLYSKKGGFGFLLTFEPDGEAKFASVSGLSAWIADKQGTTVPLTAVGVQKVSGLEAGTHAFAADLASLAIEGVDVVAELSPDGTEFSATAKKWKFPRADTVKFDAEEGYIITKDNGNPAALKLTYASGTGLFKGSFKVFGITESGKSKKFTATVNGGVFGGVGYGTAVIKKTGSIPVAVQ